MDGWFEIILFVIVIIANIIGGIIKVNQKRKKAEMPDLSEFETVDEYAENGYAKEKYSEYTEPPPKNEVRFQNSRYPSAFEQLPPMQEELKAEDIEDEENESFDYGEFMRKHGREAFILAEIILPPNSRQGGNTA